MVCSKVSLGSRDLLLHDQPHFDTLKMHSNLSQFEIKTGARLHFGLLANKPENGRHFGGAGVMIDKPGFHVSVQQADADKIVASPHFRDRIGRLLESCRSHSQSNRQIPPVRIELKQEIPPHIGLGSGTQLGMAVARVVSLVAGECDVSPIELARRADRGTRSAIGIHGFVEGGFLIDSGKSDNDEISPLVGRYDVPREWRFVLVTPLSNPGISGMAEIDAFERLPPMPQTTTFQLCGILVTQMIPALLESDCERFGDAVFDFGQLVGQYFCAVQDGTFADRGMAELVQHLREQGIRGVGQTSWGPTVFAVCSDETIATSLVAELSQDDRWSHCTFRVAAALNRGA